MKKKVNKKVVTGKVTLESLDRKFDGLSEFMTQMFSSMKKHMDGKFDIIDARLDNIDADIKDIKAELNILKEEVKILKQKIISFERVLGEHDASKLQLDIDTCNIKIDQLSAHNLRFNAGFESQILELKREIEKISLVVFGGK